MKRSVEVVRVYSAPARKTGEYRALVDRLWPRGMAKAELDHDEWAKDVAPSTDLRRWYGHDPARFAEFARRYREELRSDPAAGALERLRRAPGAGSLILLTATRDVPGSAAAVLQAVLQVKFRTFRPCVRSSAWGLASRPSGC